MSKPYQIVIGHVVEDRGQRLCKYQTQTATMPAASRVGAAMACVLHDGKLVPMQLAGNLLVDVMDQAVGDPRLFEALADDEARLGSVLKGIQTAKPDLVEFLTRMAATWAIENREDFIDVQRVSATTLRLVGDLGKRVRVALSADGASIGLLPVNSGGVEVVDGMVGVPGWGAVRDFLAAESLRLVRRRGSNWFRGTFATPATAHPGGFHNPVYFEAVADRMLDKPAITAPPATPGDDLER